jgi:predicted  nucleic acid-binding Zn-ribbon protein
MLSADAQIEKLQKRIDAREKMSGFKYAQETMAVIRALQQELLEAKQRIEKLEDKTSQ